MSSPVRVTHPLLDVLEVFVRGLLSGTDEFHGWAIMKATKRSGPTVYGVLDRLEDMGWVSGRWEDQHPELNKPRRRFYRLTLTGVTSAQEMLRERRPQALLAKRPVPGWTPVPRQAGAP